MDADGKPVAGAQLVARIYTPDDTIEVVSESANVNGEFSIEYPPGRRSYDMCHTWAYAEGYSIRVVTMARAFTDGIAEDVEIQLPANESTEFRILLPNGEPCVDAVVRPMFISVPNGAFAADEPTGLSTDLPEVLGTVLARRTGADGRVTIESIPIALLHSIEVESPEYGRQEFRKLDETLHLSKVGKINGVMMAESPGKYAGTKVSIHTAPTTPSGARLPGARMARDSQRPSWTRLAAFKFQPLLGEN